jgi:hypothetical protein
MVAKLGLPFYFLAVGASLSIVVVQKMLCHPFLGDFQRAEFARQRGMKRCEMVFRIRRCSVWAGLTPEPFV